MQESFSAQLCDRLRVVYRGRIPTAATLAAQFNYRVQDSEAPISQETARRWLRGKCLPDETRLRILAQWLSMDLQEAFSLSQPAWRPEDPMDQASAELLRLFSKLGASQKTALLGLLQLSVAEPSAAVVANLSI